MLTFPIDYIENFISSSPNPAYYPSQEQKLTANQLGSALAKGGM